MTPSYNQRRFLPEMLQSIRRQDYPYIEHIVIDGGSTDGTVELLWESSTRLAWVSEPDRGQAHAINKGFARARGEILGWLNCDDLYTPGAIRTVVDYFRSHPNAMLVYGDALAVDVQGRSYGLRTNVKPCSRDLLIGRGDFLVQPAVFWRAALWHQLGPLDESLHYALDYEYWMRAAEHFSLHYVPVCLAKERLHQGAKTANGHLKRIHELYHVAKQYGGEGVPYHFRAEAAALHGWQAVQELGTGNRSHAHQHLEICLKLRPPLFKFLIYAITLVAFGPRAIARLRLWANRLRSWRRPCYPAVENRLPAPAVRTVEAPVQEPGARHS